MDPRRRKIFTALTVVAVSLIAILLSSCMAPMGPFGGSRDGQG